MSAGMPKDRMFGVPPAWSAEQDTREHTPTPHPSAEEQLVRRLARERFLARYGMATAAALTQLGAWTLPAAE